MEAFYQGLSVGLGIAFCVLAVVLARGPLKAYLASRQRREELDALFEGTGRQLRRDHWERRRDLYLTFRNATSELVEELADGGGRWASFYLARDLLGDVNDRGAPDAALAARQMCNVCQGMLNMGFTDELSVKFDQAVRRFDIACRDDLAQLEQASWSEAQTQPAPFDAEATEPNSTRSRRRFFNVLR